jgi:hypothetical protein
MAGSVVASLAIAMHAQVKINDPSVSAGWCSPIDADDWSETLQDAGLLNVISSNAGSLSWYI